jgi:putative tryptophan/tyrosine transport system substrate-binding protein
MARLSPTNYAWQGDTPGEFLRASNQITCRSCNPAKFELVINLKTAKQLRLSIPATLLARVDEVID